MSNYLLEATAIEKNIKLLVEDAGSDLGYYLFIIDLNTQKNIADYLCDDMDEIFQVAYEDYGLTRTDFKSPKH